MLCSASCQAKTLGYFRIQFLSPVSCEELETLETEASKSIDLKEFVPLSKIDPV
jgi:non-homologous end joining protein Ku